MSCRQGARSLQWMQRHLLRVELPLHHLHEVLVRHGEGDVHLAAERPLMQSAAAVLQIDGWMKGRGENESCGGEAAALLSSFNHFDFNLTGTGD